MVLTAFACSDEKADALDPSILGIWQTDAPKYEDRFIELGEALLILGTGDHDPNIYYIKNVKKDLLKNLAIYTLACTAADDSEFTFELTITSDSKGLSLKLKNQGHVVWRKALN